MKQLIDAGSDVNDVSNSGEPLFILALGKSGSTAEILNLLLDSGYKIPDDQRNLYMLCYFSTTRGFEKIFNLAIAKCEALEINWQNWIHLHDAAVGGSVAIAGTLLAAGQDPSQRNPYGISPLHIAAENGHTDLIEFLLQQKADLESKTAAGKTALSPGPGEWS